ncbi:predicted protein [Postia placenta Mad-698-R]|uniref:Uncharacterized protein n=1 Tax=Postia placenta MAD-698-R-SB12 TaxID=670580 RepID=A0A1X6MV44_9APHY|nr:hypothetical protein POSPLADRAFT_1148175 [Postia placenta MAD-698-R-SB12]EED84463.1 predicted protein [Postia placenta Mad-698-R]OSX60092.1 hypothetical protein POSPLADRAFT_1148175 [Postia placenta MAD-698-R-SB12]
MSRAQAAGPFKPQPSMKTMSCPRTYRAHGGAKAKDPAPDARTPKGGKTLHADMPFNVAHGFARAGRVRVPGSETIVTRQDLGTISRGQRVDRIAFGEAYLGRRERSRQARSGPPARVCAVADTVSIATETVYAIGRVQIGRGTLGGVATVSAGSAAGCVKGAIVKGVSSQQRRQQQQQQTKHRADLKYGKRRARVGVVGWERAQDILRCRERKIQKTVARRRFEAAS